MALWRTIWIFFVVRNPFFLTASVAAEGAAKGATGILALPKGEGGPFVGRNPLANKMGQSPCISHFLESDIKRVVQDGQPLSTWVGLHRLNDIIPKMMFLALFWRILAVFLRFRQDAPTVAILPPVAATNAPTGPILDQLWSPRSFRPAPKSFETPSQALRLHAQLFRRYPHRSQTTIRRCRHS